MTTSRITAHPTQILGFRKARRHEKPGLYPIFPIAGGSAPAGEPAPTPPAPEPAPAPAPAPTPPAPAPAPAPAADNLWDDPAKAKAEIERLRAENGKARTTAKETAAQEARDDLLKKLGLKPDGSDEVDPEKLAAQLASKDAQLLQLQLEGAVTKVARIPAINADVDALLDSRSFATKLADLDPASKTFDDDVKKLVEAAITENPKLKLQGLAPGPSGGQFPGGSGEGTGRPTSLGQALQRRAASL